MKQLFSNATVRWHEHEIALRNALVQEIPALLSYCWNNVRCGIQFVQVETPMLVPETYLQSHISADFNLLGTDRGYLRPETTVGTYEAFKQDHPLLTKEIVDVKEKKPLCMKHLPVCYWQVGKSFRQEKTSETMRASKLRLVEFWQLEFQLFCMDNTKADYMRPALDSLVDRYGGKYIEADDLPHYSLCTVDWYIDNLEVAGVSHRTDFDGLDVFEVSIGLDRLVALLSNQE